METLKSSLYLKCCTFAPFIDLMQLHLLLESTMMYVKSFGHDCYEISADTKTLSKVVLQININLSSWGFNRSLKSNFFMLYLKINRERTDDGVPLMSFTVNRILETIERLNLKDRIWEPSREKSIRTKWALFHQESFW